MNIQLIDEFRRRTNASYDEAKYYLERFNGDLLEAIIAYEREHTGYHSYSSGFSGNNYSKGYQSSYQNSYEGYRRAPRSSNFGRGLMRVLQRLIDLKIVITDKNHRATHIPVIIPIILFPVWHIMFATAFIMLIMGFRFSIQEIPDANTNVESFVGRVKDKWRENTKSF